MKISSPEDTCEYPRLSRDELVELVDKIMNGKGNEKDIDNWVLIFQANIPHPSGSDLIFYPETDNRSAEEIVETALAYKPIRL